MAPILFGTFFDCSIFSKIFIVTGFLFSLIHSSFLQRAGSEIGGGNRGKTFFDKRFEGTVCEFHFFFDEFFFSGFCLNSFTFKALWGIFENFDGSCGIL